MKFSLNWLSDYIEITAAVPQLADKLTLAGTEVMRWDTRGIRSPHVVIAKVASYVPHPNADRLRLCRVFDGKEERQIVCGAKNFEVGSVVPLALPGAELPGGFKIKESKLRGELSQGMLCSAKELALADDAEGLLILPGDAPVGKPLHEFLAGDTVVEVEITPNRPDLLSYCGLARELAAAGGGVLKKWPSSAVSYPAGESAWAVELESNAGPFYTATPLAAVQVGESPAWLKEKINATGHKPINNVVDITNYILWETGQPLHAFDAAKLKGKKITVRFARPGESLEALDGKTYALTAEDLVIADASGPVALAGIMGGAATGVTEGTSEILLESAWFAPGAVRATARRLGILSDSSYRFERRVDPAGVRPARDRAAHLLQELAGATLAGPAREAGQVPAGPGTIRLRDVRMEKLLGIRVTEGRAENWLKALGLAEISREDGATTWQVPSFRPDLEREVDLIEEIARLHGLKGVPARLSLGIARESDTDRRHDKVAALRAALAAQGWCECLTDALIEAKRVNGEAAVELANPLNEQYTHLRPSLRAPLLQVAAHNLAHGNDVLRLFEIGRVYVPDDLGATEPLRLGFLVAGKAGETNWLEKERPADVFDLKGILDFLGTEKKMPLKTIFLEPVPKAELKEYGIKSAVYYAEIDLGSWLEAAEVPAKFRELPAFPAVQRDLALVVDKQVSHETVEKIITGLPLPTLEKAVLFDVFLDPAGEKIPAGKKSLAYALTYRAPDRTLTENEVAKWQEQVRGALKATLDCAFREN
jgi:phenylalanyl-tRNA synthetase beta chain